MTAIKSLARAPIYRTLVSMRLARASDTMVSA
jgi:hypothetical protein